VIRIRGIHKSYEGRSVLRGIDAEVAPATTVAIVGPSGGGKSTLLRCLNYLQPFEQGTIEIAGFTLRPGMGAESRATIRQLRSAVGMVFQEFHLFPHLTVLENITLAARVVGRRPAHLALRDARLLLERLDLADRGDCYPAQLSGGQKQRVAIARALAHMPRVLLFDEPTSALDPELRAEVVEVMRSLGRDGITMLVVTHELSLFSPLASQVWTVERGALRVRPAGDTPLPSIAE
jgi:ABC-type polar amino acid transport system ATPase subunit